MAYRTTAAYVSGAICGDAWGGFFAGMPHQFNLASRIDRFSDARGLTFRDILLHELMERGGDFRNARFSADSVVRVERREVLSQEQRIEKLIARHAESLGLKANFGGDPRGYTVKLHLPTGAYNTWGGKEEGYGVPQ